MKRAVMGRFSSRRFDSGRLHYSRGIGQGEDDEDDVLRERGPGLAKTCGATQKGTLVIFLIVCTI